MTWIGPANVEPLSNPDGPLDLALYNPPCLFRRIGVQALDDANVSWRLAYTTASLNSLWAGVAAGLGITLRTATGIPSALRRLGTQDGLPELPSVDLCLHGAHRKLSPALDQLKQVVLKSAAEHLAA
nr:LysR substrate-binding domain-containing protein [Burkholderia sp. MSMB1589WGS]